jgi:putative ABC transport system substrate-binding protein
VVGILSGGPPDGFTPLEPAFRAGLSEAAFVEAKKLQFEYRWARSQFDRLPGLALELVGRSPALIATLTLPAALAAKAATSAIPIVFVVGEDPVKAGLVTSLNHPGANITGMTNFMNVLGAKRLELVSETVPKADVLAFLVNPNNPNSANDTTDLRVAAETLGRRIHVVTASNDAEIELAFAAAVQHGAGALFVNIDPFLFGRREQLATIAARHRIPTIYPLRDFVAAGGLMSYGAILANAWRQAGIYAGRILKGARPIDLPVLQPTKFELVINLKTAKVLGFDIPPKVIALADEVVE